MKTKVFRFYLVLILFNSMPLLAADQFHIVKQGEIFSRIARLYFGKPTYSEAGALKKLISLNPEIKEPNRLFIGQKIRITKIVSKEVKPEAKVEARPFVLQELKAEVSPTLRIVSLKTVEKKSNIHTDILSTKYFELPVSLEQKYQDKISFYERVSLANVMFSGLQDDSSRDQKLFLWAAALGFKYADFHRFDLLVEFGYDPMLFTKDVTFSGFKIVAVNLPNIKMGVQRVLLNFHDLAFGMRANVASYFSGSHSSFKIKPGNGFGGGFFLRKSRLNSDIGIDLGVDKIYQNTSLFQQTRTDFKAMVKYEFKIF